MPHRATAIGAGTPPGVGRALWKSAIVALLLTLVPLAAPAQQSVDSDVSLASLEQLMNIKVTTVAKKDEALARTAAAVFVITAEDIRRSGATNIPDLLRMVPGVQVAQIDASAWAISIRGFDDRYSNKVLVLIDGRTVYTPTFSGVYWDQQDVVLEDIERIEVIRGPGGSVWGANAVNGVINIITKSSKRTQGGLVSAEGGSQPTASGVVQYGGKIASKGTYRVFGKYSNVSDQSLPSGTQAMDGWTLKHVGFRSDWELSPRDSLTVEGDFLSNPEGQTIPSPSFGVPLTPQYVFDRVRVNAANALGRWDHRFRGGSDISFQMYFDHYDRLDTGTNSRLSTFDLDFQDHLPLGSRHDIVWGLAYRNAADGWVPAPNLTLRPLHEDAQLFSAFFQDEVELTPSLSLTLGSRFEHNSYTGFEYEPSARLAWRVDSHTTLWAAASRAIRQPSRQERGVQADLVSFTTPQQIPGVLTIFGNPDFRSETLRDFEVGYRTDLADRLSFDWTAFYSAYRDLSSLDSKAPFVDMSSGSPRMVFPEIFGNSGSAHSYGTEFSANVSVVNRWQLSPGFTLLHINTMVHPGPADVTASSTTVRVGPQHSFSLRSSLNLPHNLDFDQSLYWVGAVPTGASASSPVHDVPVLGRTRLDVRLAWRPAERLELSVVGQNLLRPHTFEFGGYDQIVGTTAPRSVFGQVTWYF
jgi:iron complex outermembrane recepter protein